MEFVNLVKFLLTVIPAFIGGISDFFTQTGIDASSAIEHAVQLEFDEAREDVDRIVERLDQKRESIEDYYKRLDRSAE